MTELRKSIGMAASKEESSDAIKRKQYRNLLVIGGIVLVLFSSTYYLLEHNSIAPVETEAKEVRFTKAIDDKAIYSASLEQFQTQMTDAVKNADELKAQMKNLQQQALQNKDDGKREAEYQAMVTKVAALENEINTLKTDTVKSKIKTSGSENTGSNFPGIPPEGNNPYLLASNTNNAMGTAVQGNAVAWNGNDRLNLSRMGRSIAAMNPNTYVPAGTHVLGILLQGADLVADTYDQQNPKPILIRLIDNGTLPNHRSSHLKDCVITAAMTGDISSGRGDVRLERLSCVRPNNSIVDVAIFGTVATHAKEGINGEIYSRENSRLFNAGLSGTAAGIANGVSQGYVQNQNSIFGPVGHINNSDLLKYGLAQGGSTGLNRLADFEMSRADKIHPIIQVNGGQWVTVTFLQGFFFDGQKPSVEALNQNPWRGNDKTAMQMASNINPILPGDN